MKRRIELNLLPVEYRPAPAVRWLPPYLALLYSILAFGLAWIVISRFVAVASLRGEIDSLNKSISTLKPFEESYERAKQSAVELEKLKKLFNVLEAHYVDWGFYLERMGSLVPDGVWLTSITGDLVATETVTTEEPAKEKPKEGEKTATATPTQKKEKVMAVHKGMLTIKGTVGGNDLSPVSIFIDNLRKDSNFLKPYLSSAALEEEEGVQKYVFTVTAYVIIPEEQVKQEEKESAKAKEDKKGGVKS